MNKQEIDDMMKDLPSQQLPEETLTQKIVIGIIFLLVFTLMAWVPDFMLTEEECAQQQSSAYVQNICREAKKP
jgi:hypothetical protein